MKARAPVGGCVDSRWPTSFVGGARRQAGALLLACCLVVTSVRLLQVIERPRSEAPSLGLTDLLHGVSNDPISQYESRFHDLKPLLPHRGVVAYVFEGTPEQLSTFDVHEYDTIKTDYRQAQYTFVPLVLMPVTSDGAKDFPLVIGNFRGEAEKARITSDPSFRVVNDLGNGVVLLESTGR